MAVSEDVIGLLQNQGGIENGGRIYGNTSTVREFVTEEHYRRMHGQWNDEETLDRMVSQETRDAAGKLMDGAQIYGMERYALEKLMLLDGDISKLFEPNGRYIAAVYYYDDYGNPRLDSHWAKVGDTIILRYVDEWKYVENESGEVMMQPVSWRDAEYQVAALVGVPNAMSYRYFGTDAFILNDQTFIQDTGTNYIMQYSFDTTAEGHCGHGSIFGRSYRNKDAADGLRKQINLCRRISIAAVHVFAVGRYTELYYWRSGRAELL